MLTLPRNIPSSCLLRRGMLTIFLRLGIFQPAKWGIFNRRKLGNIQPALTRCIFQLLLPFCEEVLVGSVDDTLARKSGRHIWGAGMHHDPLRSTQKRPVFSFVFVYRG
jgi:hypothetical protein